MFSVVSLFSVVSFLSLLFPPPPHPPFFPPPTLVLFSSTRFVCNKPVALIIDIIIPEEEREREKKIRNESQPATQRARWRERDTERERESLRACVRACVHGCVHSMANWIKLLMAFCHFGTLVSFAFFKIYFCRVQPLLGYATSRFLLFFCCCLFVCLGFLLSVFPVQSGAFLALHNLLLFISKQFPLLINRLLKVKATFLTKQTHTPYIQLNRRISLTFLTKQTHTPYIQLNRRISFTITPILAVLQSKFSNRLQFCKWTWCLTSTETIRLIRDGEKGGEGGMEMGVEGDYTPVATLSPPEWHLH